MLKVSDIFQFDKGYIRELDTTGTFIFPLSADLFDFPGILVIFVDAKWSKSGILSPSTHFLKQKDLAPQLLIYTPQSHTH